MINTQSQAAFVGFLPVPADVRSAEVGQSCVYTTAAR